MDYKSDPYNSKGGPHEGRHFPPSPFIKVAKEWKEGKKMGSFDTTTKIMKECVTLYGRHRMNVIKFEVGFVSYCELCGEGEWTNLKARHSAPKAINPTKILTEQDAEDAANEILRRSY